MNDRDGDELHAEQAAAEAIRRLWVHRASIIVVLSQGLALLAGALLPTTAPADRAGLLPGAGLVAVAGVVWFGFVPRGLFEKWRVLVASTIAQVVMLVTWRRSAGCAPRTFPITSCHCSSR